MVEQLAGLARANLGRARLSDGSLVLPETPEELARPIIPADLAEQTVARGYLTAELEACAMDWRERSFLPYMQRLRDGRRYSGKQLAYLGLLHGFSQGAAQRALATRAPCTDTERQNLLRLAAETPILTP